MVSEIKQSFCFPIKDLSTELVKLTPFCIQLHSPTFFALAEPQQSALFAHMMMGPWPNLSQMKHDFTERLLASDERSIVYAIIDKTKPPSSDDSEGALAGIIGFGSTSVIHLITEIEPVITLPLFQRTHVTSNAIGLLLQYAFTNQAGGGMGMRRVEWQNSAANFASRRAAERFGFRYEGTMRWHRVFGDGKKRGKVGNGRGMPHGAKVLDLGRDTDVLGLCWDDWEEGKREVIELMKRR